MAEPSRDQLLKNVVAQIRSQLKDETAIMQLGENALLDIQGIPTGALSLDIALGGRGLPRGRVDRNLRAGVERQDDGGPALRRQRPEAGRRRGLHRRRTRPRSRLGQAPRRRSGEPAGQPAASGEEALKIAEMLVKSNAVDIIVIDSVAALVPRAEVEGEIGDSHVGLQARLMSQALRMLTPTVSKTKTCLIFINQIREKIGVMFGSPETTPGGRALKFFSSVRLDVRKVTGIKDGEETIGSRVKAKVVKNKVAPPFRQAEFDLMHDRGISREGDLLDLALEDKIIEKSGNWHSYGDIRLGNGREAVKQYLRDNPPLVEEISRKVLEKRGLTPAPTGRGRRERQGGRCAAGEAGADEPKERRQRQRRRTN